MSQPTRPRPAQSFKPPSSSAEAPRPGSRKLGILRALWPFVRPYRLVALAALLALVMTASVSLILPIAVRRVIDNFQADAALLDGYFASAFGFVALLALGTGLRYLLITRLGEKVVADIRNAVFASVIDKSPAFFDSLRTGEILSRITTDTTLVLSVISSSVSIGLRNALILTGGIVLMLFTSMKLTALALLVVPLVVGPILILGRRLRRLSRENQDWIAASSGQASEALLAVQTVQAFTHEAESRRAFATITERALRAAQRRINTRATMTMIVIFLIFSGVVGVLWIGARDVRAAAITHGTLVQFVIYAVMVAGAVGALSEIWGELQRAAGATDRLVALLRARDSVRDVAAPMPMVRPVVGCVTFDNVVFRYPSRPQIAALDGVSLTIEAGETVALVGPSGAGKSTLVQLLLRFYDPQEGQITLDGVPLARMRRQEFRQAMALVPQEPVIFAATARDNIRFGRLGASDAQVENAARAAAAHGFISALPEGYDSFVGERGVMLSGGQKQRIALARAILREAPVLLLDEATSALDAQSEQLVQQAVDGLRRGRTTLVVAHRLATVKKADRIVVMAQGRIVAQGSHDALVAQGGLYARLARLQFTDGAAAPLGEQIT